MASLDHMPAPQAFSVAYRNPGHWDVCAAGGRAFRIRGLPGLVLVIDEREGDAEYGRHPRPWLRFPTVAAAMTWITFQFMAQPGHP